ncbi:MAG: phosphoethanolamine--lipid A transferase [Desulfuromonadales bacterium]|nr:phosphoethanolamine--lipid A transferase [Desulfuromonadales bacterium]
MKISSNRLIILTAVFIVIADNYKFFSDLTDVFPVTIRNIGFLVSTGVIFASFLVVLFSIFNTRLTLKPILILSVLTAAISSYFINAYHIIIDDTMIRNVVETNMSESFDLASFRLVLYVVFLGILPSLFIYKAKVDFPGFKRAMLSRFLTLTAAVFLILIVMLPFSKFYTSFFREHKPLRYNTNPTYFFYSVGKYLSETLSNSNRSLQKIGLDAQRDESAVGRRLAIVVIGEAVRADRFSLNGYGRMTNPLLGKEDIVNFPEMYSCGTTTAVSVPCMFSLSGREGYSDKVAKSTENVLDVLSRAGVEVLWRDNNSSSKGVADRVHYEDFRTQEVNPDCNGECRDEGMLAGLQNFIEQQRSGDILIVLHQMGNHGPAYYKRYPARFQIFAPVCATNQLEECHPEEISNAYDNAVLYTDYFLAQVVDLLKENDGTFDTAMLYMSDHGESLGEGGLYLHGMPYSIAPEAQKHVASLLWLGQSTKAKINVDALQRVANNRFSHDNLPHTLLGLMKVKTSVYVADKDILAL